MLTGMSKRRRRLWISLAPIVVMTLVVAAGTPLEAAPPPNMVVTHISTPTPSPGVGVSHPVAVSAHVRKPNNPAGQNAAVTDATWPAATASAIALSPLNGSAKSGNRVRVGKSPVWMQSVARAKGGPTRPTTARVTVLDHSAADAAGVSGVLFTVAGSSAAATAEVGVDYASFAKAYGGNFGARLGIVEYPTCVLTTPSVAACRQPTPLPSTNNYAAQSVSAQVKLPQATPSGITADATTSGVGQLVFAAQTAPVGGDQGGAGGTFGATSLKASGSWTAGGSTGSFDYDYPISVPPAASDLVPQVALSYDSSSVDGETAVTDAQASWVGDGWSTPDSFIEESFAPCSDNPEGTASPTSTPDNCYDGPILTLSLGGSSSSLVWDASASVWKSQNDGGQVITHVTNGGDNGSGTYNHDYWKVTDTDGTVYEFGLNHLPGWATGDAATNSVDSEPVYSAHSGDPCFNISGTGFTHSVCTMAYRWHLDYVKDVHGNAMSYYYAQATNKYGEDKGASVVSYIRDSFLAHIDYGFTDGHAYSTIPDQILFTPGDRCVATTCDPLSATTKTNWPDVPFDLICSGTTCSNWSPAFFSTVRLASITAKQYSTTAAKLVPVDTYTLTQTIPGQPTGDTTAPTLWLNTLVHTGNDTTAGGSSAPLSMPAITFSGEALPNRTDAVTDGLPAFDRYRLFAIQTETGSTIGVTYELPYQCSAPVTISPASNTSSCYPVSWTPTDFPNPIIDWFNKYAVQAVTQSDPTGGNPQMVTSYTYPGRPAWHFDDNELVKAKYRTYGQFRGYQQVDTFTGDGGNDPQTESDDVYYQGMSKDNNTTVVNLTDSQGGVHEDVNQLSGNELESTTHQGRGGPIDSSTITSYWVSPATATRSRTGLPALTANKALPIESWTRTAATSTGTAVYRVSETDSTYNTTITSPLFGQQTEQYKHTVPINTALDECTSDTYAAANTTANIVGLTAEEETDSIACGGFTEGAHPSVPGSVNTLTQPAASRPSQVISDERTFYDDSTFSTTFPQAAAPAKGDETMTQSATDTTGSLTYQTMTRSTYDSVGRPVTTFDANGNKSMVAYTANSVGLNVGVTTTNPLGQTSSTTLDPERALTLVSKDLNGITTTAQYDALGRTTSVWTQSRAISTPANQTFSYLINSGTGHTTAETTKTLRDNGLYATSTTIYDALLRVRQTQAMTVQGGRIVNDTFYDSRGWISATFNNWWDPATTPNTTLVSPAALNPVADVFDSDSFTYDGLGRKLSDVSKQDGVVKSTTSTVYNGDQTTTIPPTGGTIETTKNDALGRNVELDQYTTAPTVHTPANTFTGYFTTTPVAGSVQPTLYTYDSRGNQATVQQGTGGPTWTSTFNLRGQVTRKIDPDGGDSGAGGIVYDANGNAVQSTDGRGKTISYKYDALDRKVAEYDSSVSGQASANQMASWVYDNSNNAVVGMVDPIGQLTTETEFTGGIAYTTQQSGFNAFGESTGETITIPTADGPLANPYQYSHTYSATNGLLLHDVYPAFGGLPAETVIHNYDNVLGLPLSVSGLAPYGTGVQYDAFSRPTQETLGSLPANGTLTNTYDQHTGRLSDQLLQSTTAKIDEQHYMYDPAGNLTIQQSTRNGAATPTETQCFAYNTLDQLSSAWTATDNCAASPTDSSNAMVGDSLGVASAYWTTWSVDAQGDRQTQVQHAFTGGPASNTTTAYTYGTATSQPHTLTATSGATTGPTSYTYDTAGNMVTRHAAQGNQTLTYNDADQLTSISSSTNGTTNYKYDADGSLLIQQDPGTTTLYLPGEQIALNRSLNTVSGTRYYPLPGGGLAVRTGTAASAYEFELTDGHGTPSLYVNNTFTTPTWSQTDPYGNRRGAAVTAPDNHGFLGKPSDDSTGLTDVGARFYDPTTGRFTTLDPMFEADDPGQLDGFSYTANNPVTFSDPTGTCIKIDGIVCGSELKTAAGRKKLNDGEADQNNRMKRLDMGADWAAAQRKADPERYAIHKPKPQHHKSLWDRATGGIAKAASGSLHWAENHSNVVGMVAGVAAGLTCEALTAGAGTVLCGAIGGFVQSATTDGLNVAAGDESWSQFGVDVGIGTVAGALGGAAGGKILGGSARAAEEAGAAEQEMAIPAVIYRGGGKSPSNFRLREGESALSFRDSLTNPLPPGKPVLHPGKEYVGLDTSKLPAGSVVPDGVPGSTLTPPGHVSVYVDDPMVLKAAIIESGKFPK
jgi:RHS repeat-associated protein